MSKNELVIIPKIEAYIEYMLTILIKLPRTEKSLKSHKKTRRGKREKKEIILFELNLENEILNLEKELKLGRYKPGAYKSFKVYDQKKEL